MRKPERNQQSKDESTRESVIRVDVGRNLSIKVNMDDLVKSDTYKKAVNDAEKHWDTLIANKD